MHHAPQLSHTQKITNALIPTAAITNFLDYIIYISLIFILLPSIAIFKIIYCNFNNKLHRYLHVRLNWQQNAFPIKFNFKINDFYFIFSFFGFSQRSSQQLLNQSLLHHQLYNLSSYQYQNCSNCFQFINIIIFSGK